MLKIKIAKQKIRWLATFLLVIILFSLALTIFQKPKKAEAAIAVDSSTPAMKFVSTASTSWSSNSFTPPANSLLVAVIGAASGGATTPTVSSMSDSLGTHLTWTKYNNINTFTDTETEIWWAYTTSAQTSMTATVNWNVSTDGAVGIIVLTGARANQSGAATGTNSSGNGTPSKSITTTANNSLVLGAVSNWNSGSVTPTIPSGQGDVFNSNTYFVNNTNHDSGFWAQRQNAATATSGTSVTINDTAPTGIEYSMVAVEILANNGDFPTTPVIDNFNRANATLSSSTASGGATWGTTISYSNVALSITSNQVTSSTTGFGSSYISSPSSYGPDSEAYATVSTVGVSSGNEICGLALRTLNPTLSSVTGYLLEAHQGASNTFRFVKVTSGPTETTVSQNFTNQQISAGDSVGFTVTGTTNPVLTAYYKSSAGSWTQVGTYTDTGAAAAYQGSGAIGLEVDGNTPRVDDFSGGKVVASSSNSVPAAPTLSSPASGATGVAVLPALQLKTTDADNDYLRYRIKVYDNSGGTGSANCAADSATNLVRDIDQTSSQTGWSGQDQQSSTAYAGNSSIGSSTTATHNYQATALSVNTLYYWKAQAIDPGGSNTFGSWSACQSFTTITASTNVQINGGTTIQGGTIIQ